MGLIRVNGYKYGGYEDYKKFIGILKAFADENGFA